MYSSKTLLKLLCRSCRPHRIGIRSLGISRYVRNEASSEAAEKPLHTPVMLREVIQYLSPNNDQVFIDMTFGAGGHARELLRSAKGIKVYGVDRDTTAYQLAQKLASEEFPDQLVPVLGRFSELPLLLANLNVPEGSIDGVLIDAGCSSMQFDQSHRGFSVSRNGPLDMRMDGDRFPSMATAADVVNTLNVVQLAKIFKIYGDEKQAKKIAQTLFDARFMMKSIHTTKDMADLVAIALQTEARRDKLDRKTHSATKVFQALRIFVNNELNELNYAVDVAHRFLRPVGRLAVVTFHSLEDRIVKRHLMGINMDEPFNASLSLQFRNAAKTYTLSEMEELHQRKWEPLAKGVVLPSEEEVFCNPRSRSAKLRAALKIDL